MRNCVVNYKFTFQWKAFASLIGAKEPLKTPVLRKLEIGNIIHTINTKLMCFLASFNIFIQFYFKLHFWGKK